MNEVFHLIIEASIVDFVEDVLVLDETLNEDVKSFAYSIWNFKEPPTINQ